MIIWAVEWRRHDSDEWRVRRTFQREEGAKRSVARYRWRREDRNRREFGEELLQLRVISYCRITDPTIHMSLAAIQKDLDALRTLLDQSEG